MQNTLQGTIAIFGGSFDPPHMAHQMLCLVLLEALQVDAVWVMPAFAHPLGKTLSSYEARVHMCELLARPFGARVVVSRLESELHGSGRTYDLLAALKVRYPTQRFALAVGADILNETAQWYRWEDICRMVRVVVVGRSGSGQQGDVSLDLPDVQSRTLRAKVRAKQSIRGYVPASIAEYIEVTGMYA